MLIFCFILLYVLKAGVSTIISIPNILGKSVYFMSYINLKFQKAPLHTTEFQAFSFNIVGLGAGKAPLYTTKFQAFSFNIACVRVGESP